MRGMARKESIMISIRKEAYPKFNSDFTCFRLVIYVYYFYVLLFENYFETFRLMTECLHKLYVRCTVFV